MSRDTGHTFVTETDDDDGATYIDALDSDGDRIASARYDEGRWVLLVEDGTDMPEAYVGDEASARAWLDFIARSYAAPHLT